MEKYIGVKVIEAEPMVAEKAYGKHGIDDEGYKVKYEDGYESWSPKDVFESAYRSTKGMTFGLAVEALKKGQRVALPFWAKDVYISMQFRDEHSKMTHNYLYVTSRFGLVPWVATQIEILSEDWVIVE